MEANAEFKCEICDQQYSAKHSLKRHFDSVHGNKNFQCNICTKKFLNSGNLKIHMDKKAHNQQNKHKIDHKCDSCTKSFSSSQYANNSFWDSR